MDEKHLMSLGLSQTQARAYRALVMRKSLRPNQLAKMTGESRTNCYAILDKLTELGLATKADKDRKFTYFPTSPLSIRSLIDNKRLEAEKQLQHFEAKLPQMMSAYHEGGEQPKIRYYKGKKELETMYVEQLEEPSRDLCFIRSSSDIAYFGLDKMKEIRYLSGEYHKRRRGITPVMSPKVVDLKKDAKAGGLKRAIITREEYTANVEWAVTGNTVQAILLKGEGYGLSIDHPEIAESFRQILGLLYDYIRKSPSVSAD